jgi:uncharacterized protein YqhQ
MRITSLHKGILLTFGIGFLTSAFEMLKNSEYYLAIFLAIIGLGLLIMYSYLIEKQGAEKVLQILEESFKKKIKK